MATIRLRWSVAGVPYYVSRNINALDGVGFNVADKDGRVRGKRPNHKNHKEEKKRAGQGTTHNLTRLKTPRTFKSSVF